MIQCRGDLKIAEVTSRFENVDGFVAFVSSFGFKLNAKVSRLDFPPTGLH